MNTKDLHRNCIAFGEWLLINCEPIFCNGKHYHCLIIGAGFKKYTTEELFEIYLKTLNNE